MNFDREYDKTRRPVTPDDFADSNVQALVEGRRTRPLPGPRPNVSATVSQLRSLEDLCSRLIAKHGEAL